MKKENDCKDCGFVMGKSLPTYKKDYLFLVHHKYVKEDHVEYRTEYRCMTCNTPIIETINKFEEIE